MSAANHCLGNDHEICSQGENDRYHNLIEFSRLAENKPKTARFVLLAAAQNIMHEERIRVCCRVRVPIAETVNVMHNAQKCNARYVGLMKCGLGWICPICAYRLSEERRSMLEKAFQNARGKYIPYLATYTIRHQGRQRLSDMLDAMHKAYTAIRKDRDWKLTKQEWGIVGEIRATEVSYSFTNGFHPHYHVVILSNVQLDDSSPEAFKREQETFAESLENQLWQYWSEYLPRFGLDASREHGIDVQDASFVSKYVAKGATWTLEKELSKTVTKAGREGNFMPFDLLVMYACGDKMSASIFEEYAQATKGRSALQWTPGLKALLGVSDAGENTDTWDNLEIGETCLIRLSDEEWHDILKCGASGRLLDIASTGDYEKVAVFVGKLREQARLID